MEYSAAVCLKIRFTIFHINEILKFHGFLPWLLASDNLPVPRTKHLTQILILEFEVNLHFSKIEVNVAVYTKISQVAIKFLDFEGCAEKLFQRHKLNSYAF